MKAFLQAWFNLAYAVPFKIIGVFYRSYTSNRARVKAWLEGPGIGSVVRTLMVLTVVVWLLIWFLAPEDKRTELTETIKKQFNVIQQ